MSDQSDKYEISLQEILNRAQVERQDDSSITQTAKFLISASYFENSEDIINTVKEKLSHEDPRKLFLDCLKHIVNQIQTCKKSQQHVWVDQLLNLGVRGLGIKIDDLELIGKDSKNIFRDVPKWDNIKKHIDNHVLGNTFLMKMSVKTDSELWGNDNPLRVSSCDASQHRFKLALPFYNKRFSTPVVVNNAAGIIKEKSLDTSNWINIVVPKSVRDFEDWVIVGPDDYSSLEENDYEWATKSAMDVGQFFVEESYVFSYGGSSKRPDVHLHDGTIFPQDHAMNCRYNNRRGELTRESILRMTNTLRRAKDLGIIYSGIAKNVQLKMYSIVIDYYIKEILKDEKWNVTQSLLPDSEIMRFLLPTKNFDASTFNEIYVTCPIIRSFYVKSNLNSRTDKQVKNDLNSLSLINHNRTLSAKNIVETAFKTRVAMFFAGHSNSDEYYVPRYEFVYYDEYENSINEKLMQILSAIRFSVIDKDEDHMKKLDEPILVPSPLIYAHELSKSMGDELVKNWTARTWNEFLRLKENSS